MPLDPSIPLQSQVVPININPGLNALLSVQQANRQKELQPLQNRLLTAQAQGAEQQIQSGKLAQLNDEQKSLMMGAAELKPLIDAGDTEGARAVLLRRQAAAKALGLPDTHSAEGLQLLDTQGIGALKQPTEALYQAGLKTGVLQDPSEITPMQMANYQLRQQEAANRSAQLASDLDFKRQNLDIAKSNLALARQRGASDAEIKQRELEIRQQEADTKRLTAGNGKAPTESQAKANAFAGEMDSAMADMDAALAEMGDPGKPATKPSAMSMIAGVLPIGGETARRIASSPAEQKYYNGLKRLITAKLRADSGATITQSEIDQQLDQYMPRVTDSAELIAQKKSALSTLVQSVRSRGTQQLSVPGVAPAALSPEDQAAVNWARANPNDPRAAQIMQLHGGR